MSDNRELTRAELEPYAHTHSVVAHMLANDIPLTRANYITQAYLGDEPSPAEWNHEHEAALPLPFQDPNAVIPD